MVIKTQVFEPLFNEGTVENGGLLFSYGLEKTETFKNGEWRTELRVCDEETGQLKGNVYYVDCTFFLLNNTAKINFKLIETEKLKFFFQNYFKKNGLEGISILFFCCSGLKLLHQELRNKFTNG